MLGVVQLVMNWGGTDKACLYSGTEREGECVYNSSTLERLFRKLDVDRSHLNISLKHDTKNIPQHRFPCLAHGGGTYDIVDK